MNKKNILFIIALPLLIGALYFAAAGSANKISIANEAALTDLGQTVRELRQALEKEKEASGLFLDSKGAKFASELLTLRAKTDKRIKELKTFMLKEFALNNNSKKYGADFKQGLFLALENIGRIEACRAAVGSFSITAGEAAEYYTEVDRCLSETVRMGGEDEAQTARNIQENKKLLSR